MAAAGAGDGESASALIGVEAARRSVIQFVSGYSEKELKLLLLSGPPGSGKTTLAELIAGYTLYRNGFS